MLRYYTPQLVRRIYPSLVWQAPDNNRAVYLTFDDGPNPIVTPWVLEQLAAYQARGTFFCVGDNVSRYPQVVEEIRRQGHALGNHTYHHLKGWRHSLGKYVEDVKLCADVLPSGLFRPPYGKITRKQLKALRDNYRIIMWSVLSRDFDPELNVAESLEALKKYTVPGSIVVFHDSYKAEDNLKQLLPAYLQYCKERGFTFESLQP